MLCWRRGTGFLSTVNERLWIHSGLRKIMFDQGSNPEKSPIEADGPNDPTFQRTSVGVFSEFCIQNSLKTTD